MIIEAGYDILQLLCPEVMKDAESQRAVWVLSMDERLRLLFIGVVAPTAADRIESHVEDIAKALTRHPGPAKYYVVARTVQSHKGESGDWLRQEDERLNHLPALADHELLGQVVFDPDGYFSSVPRYSFRDYPELEHLPRTAILPGPHPLMSCDCLACVQHKIMLDDNRRRAEKLANPGRRPDIPRRLR
ncbi:MAG TPA: hypothetical protein VGC18_12375 [Lacisediminihabitans sp.]|uniref:hypothetical protein n=1 Tax=Lacisediminihabitans sp. TaxID=2787631 RepID=UPI002EDAD737